MTLQSMLTHEVTCLMSVGVIILVFGQVSLSLSLLTNFHFSVQKNAERVNWNRSRHFPSNTEIILISPNAIYLT
jgi:cell division protein FtsX